jgi:hypothetical protein
VVAMMMAVEIFMMGFMMKLFGWLRAGEPQLILRAYFFIGLLNRRFYCGLGKGNSISQALTAVGKSFT